jgi:hypothetical protein
VAKELETYRTIYRQVNGVDAPPPVSAGWTFCDRDPERARDMARRYIGGYYQTVLDHYQFQGDHLAHTKGYEYYGKMAEKIHQYGTDTVIDYFMNLQVWGTPEQCYEKILDIHARTGNSSLRGRVRLRRDALRGRRAEHAAVRAGRDAGPPVARGGAERAGGRRREAGRGRPPRLLIPPLSPRRERAGRGDLR